MDTKGKNAKQKKWNACKGISIDREVLRIYWEEANLDGSRSYRAFVEHTETSSMDRDSVEKLLRMRWKEAEWAW